MRVALGSLLSLGLLAVPAAGFGQAGLCLLGGDDDGDGLSNEWERGCSNNRSSCRDVDTDGDLIFDATEAGPGDARDSDSDGLIDSCESDSDGDGISDRIESGCNSLCTNTVDTDGDNLPDYRDPDSDGDGVPDAAEGTEDADGDGLANWRDANDADGPLGDLDEDGALNPDDNCPATANADQLDGDGDGVGDACEQDDDNDGVADEFDNCPMMPNAGQADLDQDDIGDACDPDLDGDEIENDVDNCPRTHNPDQADVNSDGRGDACSLAGDRDTDMDGLLDDVDNCPEKENAEQQDLDGDGLGDACDPDADDDGIEDGLDNCLGLPNYDQADLDADAIGDPCDSDIDGDGIEDDADNCRRLANGDQADLDADQLGDACDADADGDGVEDARDNCLGASNPGQADQDADGLGDACDPDDADGDGVLDYVDNCPGVANADQGDGDGDDLGDACDPDLDGDGFLDESEDNCPDTANDQNDLDQDGAGDACDDDADGDGVLDLRESALGTNPLDAADFPRARGGSCRTAEGVLELHVLLLIGVFLLRSRRRASAAAAILLLLAASDARAQVDAQLLRPQALDRGGAAVESSEVLVPFGFQAAVWGGHAGRPVELVGGDGRRIAGVVDGLSTVDLRLTLGLPLGFELSTLLPVQVTSGDGGPASVSGAGIGDWSVSVKWLALDPREWAVGLSAKAELFLPTGDRDRLGGDGGIGGAATLAVDRSFGPVLLAANFGGRFRDGVRAFEGASIGQQLTYGAVADWEIIEDLHVAAELYGALGISRGEDAQPIEALGTARYRIGPVLLAAGGGAGLNDAVGVPAWRAFGALGIVFEPEDEDADQDGDGLVDARDPCPGIAEDRDGFQDHDGCPDADNDEDGIADGRDACVNAAEDLDGFQDDDGCPDNDDDGDGLVDGSDRCPRLAETLNAFQDEDGCPDTAPKYLFEVGSRLVFNDIQFRSNSYDLLADSFAVLDEIVKSLQEQPDVRIRIEGHTDGQGDAKDNLVLSQQRALAVLNYLVSAGVDAKRVEHAGYGDTRPVAGNDTQENRALNRRVELVTLERMR